MSDQRSYCNNFKSNENIVTLYTKYNDINNTMEVDTATKNIIKYLLVKSTNQQLGNCQINNTNFYFNEIKKILSAICFYTTHYLPYQQSKQSGND